MEAKNYTMYNLKSLTADGKEEVLEYKSEAQYEKIKAEADKFGTTISIIKGATFELAQASSWEEATELVPDAEVRLNYFNYGFGLAQHNRKKDLMEDVDWPGVEEGSYKLINDVQVLKEKRVADPLSKSRRDLRELAKANGMDISDEQINEVLRNFFTQQTSSAA